jgi:16S rRNA (cytosine1402-N4)-methyltransferase
MHKPVLLKEIIEYLNPQKGDSYLDLTAGYGGHSGAILEISKNYLDSVLVDRDQMAVDYLKEKFGDKEIRILHSDFYEASKLLVNEEKKFNMILADLGVSSPHLDIASRGFSFQNPGPLDMRMDQRQQLTAAMIVNEWDKEKIEYILRVYGEEPHHKKIAQIILDNRPIQTTDQLATIIAKSSGKWFKKNPATRTFQALRIAVNDEIQQLEYALPLWFQLLKPGGRIGIISFHSLEDRIIKNFFNEYGGDRYDADFKIILKSPVTASKNELVINPRSRSAKLRVAAK